MAAIFSKPLIVQIREARGKAQRFRALGQLKEADQADADVDKLIDQLPRTAS